MPGISAITDLDYGWLAFFSKELPFLSMQLGAIVSVNNEEPGFRAISDLF